MSFLDFGNFALFFALLSAVSGFCIGLLGSRNKKDAYTVASVRCLRLTSFFAMLSLFILGVAFVSDTYTNQYVWQHSNRDMDSLYKLTAIWGGMDGSMLLWASILTVAGALAVVKFQALPRALMRWVVPVLHSSNIFFLTIVFFLTNPFRYINAPFIPADGNGLNPLLQNPYMAIHPPTLYLGFTTFSVPFAFCLGALLSGQLSSEWIRLTRRWTLVAWGFLTAGIVLGGHWAYLELGWGGFWAWDPVENSSFLPWLTGTAFLHSVMVQERKDMLKVWNVWLIILTYSLTVFGTFLTRSGVVESVHAFASTDIGPVFLGYLAVIFLVSLACTFYRRKDLRSERTIESLFSREAAFLLNNLVLLSICFATLWGVLFPVLSEWVTGSKQAVGIPFFNTVNVPLFLILIFLMGIGPLIAWKKASVSSLYRTFFMPFLLSLCIGVLLVFAGVVSFYPVLAYCLSFFAIATVMGELYRGYKARRRSGERSAAEALGGLVKRHRSRYGGYLIHIGIAVMAISITASMAHKVEKEFSLSVGETFEQGRFSFTLQGFGTVPARNYDALQANMELKTRNDGSFIALMKPEMRIYRQKQENTTEVALRMGLLEDVYLVLAGTDATGSRATFKLFINPLQVWLWIGTLIVLLGTAIVVLPGRVGALIRKDQESAFVVSGEGAHDSV